jgi:CheY-like chemotaxis protein
MSASTMNGRASHTILVVDDEFVMVEIVSMILAEEGYRVLTAADGEEALALLAEEVPDLLITDYMMPKVTGPQLVDRMSADERLSAVPIIMMSGGSVHVRPAGVRAFFVKPVPVDDLLSAVATILADSPVRSSDGG